MVRLPYSLLKSVRDDGYTIWHREMLSEQARSLSAQSSGSATEPAYRAKDPPVSATGRLVRLEEDLKKRNLETLNANKLLLTARSLTADLNRTVAAEVRVIARNGQSFLRELLQRQVERPWKICAISLR